MAENDARNDRLRATVARGRTIVAADPSQKVIIGYDAEGKPIQRARSVTHLPGSEVTLPADEVKRLRKIGFLVDPDVVVPPRGEGPSFTEQGRNNRAA